MREDTWYGILHTKNSSSELSEVRQQKYKILLNSNELDPWNRLWQEEPLQREGLQPGSDLRHSQNHRDVFSSSRIGDRLQKWYRWCIFFRFFNLNSAHRSLNSSKTDTRTIFWYSISVDANTIISNLTGRLLRYCFFNIHHYFSDIVLGVRLPLGRPSLASSSFSFRNLQRYSQFPQQYIQPQWMNFKPSAS